MAEDQRKQGLGHRGGIGIGADRAGRPPGRGEALQPLAERPVVKPHHVAQALVALRLGPAQQRDAAEVESLALREAVDRGDTWRNSVPGYLPRWNPFFTKEVIIRVAPREEIGPRLDAMGLDPARDLSAVVLTHFHHAHTGGLDHVPHTRIIAPRESYEASRGFKGMMMGCLPQRWPTWFKPELVTMDGSPVGPFPASHAITGDGRILLVPTPGHAAGHASVIVRGDGVTWFLAGDATYDEANLREEKADGVTNDPALSVATLRAIKAFAAQEPTVILPAHDPGGPRRLAEGAVFRGA